jgi:hypothetical protein
MVRILFLLPFLILASCSNDRELPEPTCEVSYLYAISGEPTSLTPITGVLWVEFLDSENLETQIQSLFDRYEFLDEKLFPVGNFSIRVPFGLTSKECDDLYQSLEILNQDEFVAAATPRFRLDRNGINDQIPWTLVNGISIHPNNEGDIPAILEWAFDNGLVWKASTYLTQRFAVKDVKTGFEPLEIAIKAQKELNVRWAEADFIVPITRWP